jgi:hypothetical protein
MTETFFTRLNFVEWPKLQFITDANNVERVVKILSCFINYWQNEAVNQTAYQYQGEERGYPGW